MDHRGQPPRGIDLILVFLPLLAPFRQHDPLLLIDRVTDHLLRLKRTRRVELDLKSLAVGGAIDTMHAGVPILFRPEVLDGDPLVPHLIQPVQNGGHALPVGCLIEGIRVAQVVLDRPRRLRNRYPLLAGVCRDLAGGGVDRLEPTVERVDRLPVRELERSAR